MGGEWERWRRRGRGTEGSRRWGVGGKCKDKGRQEVKVEFEVEKASAGNGKRQEGEVEKAGGECGKGKSRE